MITAGSVWIRFLTFALAGAIVIGIAGLFHWHPYSTQEYFDILFGWLCGGFAIRSIANKEWRSRG